VKARGGIRARARQIRLLVMDVDGVLTDGRMVLSDRGDELKAFNTHDGVAIELARRGGLRTAMVTGEKSPIARIRGEKLGVDAVVLGARRKGEALQALCQQFDVPAEAVAYVGDDLIDIPALEQAGLPIAVADAAAEVKRIARVVTRAPGGAGAVREVVELILKSQGAWPRIVDGFIRDHGGRGRRG
jgi:3-deoxy-D-manno-octulosonate 8-phosphate phosphatase (KDO 8-P phosphatase)